MAQPISVRLTTDIRASVAQAMLKHRFTKEATRILDDRAGLARAVYDDLYRGKDRKLIESLPKGWLQMVVKIKAQFGGEVDEIPFNGCSWRFRAANLGIQRETVALPIAARDDERCVAVYEASHRFAKRREALDVRLQDFLQRFRAAEGSAAGALASVNTSGRLKELWPESAPFLKPFEQAVPNLPSIPVTRLNELLGLPAAKTAVAA